MPYVCPTMDGSEESMEPIIRGREKRNKWEKEGKRGKRMFGEGGKMNTKFNFLLV